MRKILYRLVVFFVVVCVLLSALFASVLLPTAVRALPD